MGNTQKNGKKENSIKNQTYYYRKDPVCSDRCKVLMGSGYQGPQIEGGVETNSKRILTLVT